MTGAGHYCLTGQFAQRAHDRLKQEGTQGTLACAAIAQAYSALVNVPDSRREQAAKQQDRPIPRSGQSGELAEGPGRAAKRQIAGRAVRLIEALEPVAGAAEARQVPEPGRAIDGACPSTRAALAGPGRSLRTWPVESG
jgi:hypothetical protein